MAGTGSEGAYTQAGRVPDPLGTAGGSGRDRAAQRVLPARTRSAVLHELKSPVTAIIGFSETLARQVTAGSAAPARLADRLGRIRAAAVRIDELLDELRDLPD